LAAAGTLTAATSDGGCASDCWGVESTCVDAGCMDAGSVSWENGNAEVSVTITVPEQTKSKDVTVSIKDQWLCVSVGTLAGERATRPLIDGQLFQMVKPLDSDWTFEDVKDGGRQLVITLEKETKMRWFELIRGKGTTVLDALVV